MTTVLELSRAQVEKILAHCRREAPNEACGLLSGHDGRVTRVWPTRNGLASPTEYLIAPEDQFAVMRAVWAAGEELLAIFHSHPKTLARPSARDQARAYYPEVAYLIVSLSPTEGVRAFHLDRGRVIPVELEVPDE